MTAHADPLWALAAGCVPDADPWEIPRIAAQAGFNSCGMWVDPKTTWRQGALQRTREALVETGISLIDVEVIWLEGGEEASDHQKQVVDAGLELGARNVLIVSRQEDQAVAVSQFRSLCEYASGEIRVCLEFGEFTEVKSLQAAKAFIAVVDHPAAGILTDLMHLNRSGEALPDLTENLFPYVQACDFWQASASKTGMAYITAAVDERCCLGEGEASHQQLTDVSESAIDVSLEIRSKALRESFPDPYERALQIFERCVRKSY